MYVFEQWLAFTKPILLAYHDGTLLYEWRKDFLKYLVSKKVFSVQDIDWEEAKSLFPSHNSSSLLKALLPILQRRNKYNVNPLHQVIEDYLPKMKNALNKQSVAYRERIAYLYDQARGVLKE